MPNKKPKYSSDSVGRVSFSWTCLDCCCLCRAVVAVHVGKGSIHGAFHRYEGTTVVNHGETIYPNAPGQSFAGVWTRTNPYGFEGPRAVWSVWVWRTYIYYHILTFWTVIGFWLPAMCLLFALEGRPLKRCVREAKTT